jgi:hypothetical protein
MELPQSGRTMDGLLTRVELTLTGMKKIDFLYP